MKSVIELDINAPQAKVAELFSDPNNNPKWMDDLERIEPMKGTLGEPGSVYRLIPKQGDMVFVATVVSQELPERFNLFLDSKSVSVSIADQLLQLSADKTKLISTETFDFKGILNKLFSLFARAAIKRVHRRHMEAFKRYAEREAK